MDGIQQTLAAASESLKKHGGWKRIVGHVLGEAAEVGVGAVVAYAGSRAARAHEIKKIQKQADQLQTEGKHVEANTLRVHALAQLTLIDEAALYKVLPLVDAHFRDAGEPLRAVTLFNSLLTLDSIGMSRWREISLRAGDQAEQVKVLVSWGDMELGQQIRSIQLAQLALPKDEQAGHVLSDEIRRVAVGQRDKSNAHVDEIKAGIRAKRARRLGRP